MQASDSTTVPAFTIGMETCGNLAPPFRFDGKVAIARRGHTSRSNFPRDSSQERVTKKANFSRFAVDGAAMLAGFYHRSVLRCGCLAERKSGVRDILSATRYREKVCVDLSRIGYPGQPRPHQSQSIQFAEKLKTFSFRAKRGISFLFDLSQRDILWLPRRPQNDQARHFFRKQFS